MSDGGKGSTPRPFAVDQQTYENNFTSIFGISKLERKRREEALREMVRLSEEMGLYDDCDFTQNRNPDIIALEDAKLEDEAFSELEKRINK